MTDSRSDNSHGAALRPEVQKIIRSGRMIEPTRSGLGRSAFALAFLSGALLWASFTPLELAPLAWFALVPLLQLARLQSLPPKTGLLVWLAFFFWNLITLQWMRLGHPAMYGALVALAAYLAFYPPIFLWAVRRAGRAHCPLWLATPIVWVCLEFARAWVFTGFSWYYLGHSQYRWLSLIQIADVTGSWGVSFLLAMSSGVLAELVPTPWLQQFGLDASPKPVAVRWLPPFALVGTFAVCIIYGTVRLTPASEFSPGPTVALVQGNFTPELKHNPDLVMTRFRVHNGLMQQAIALRPDLIVWPETMFPWPEQNAEPDVTDEQILSQVPLDVLRDYGNESHLLVDPFRNQEVQKSLASHAKATGAALVIGLEAVVAGKDGTRVYNSAAFVRPDLGYIGRYDKIHRVIFGEYIPLRDLFPWLSNLTPFGAGFGIDAGQDVRMFEYNGFHFAPLICFEDTVPQLVRRMAEQRDAEGRTCDVLVNLTNDAWFHGSSELDQHLITAAFRCVETRHPMVRSVNGGISAIIDGNGSIREPAEILKMKEPFEGLRPELEEVQGMKDPETGKWRRQFSGLVFGEVPLDLRESLYVKFGDWFAWLCTVITTGLVALSLRTANNSQATAQRLTDS